MWEKIGKLLAIGPLYRLCVSRKGQLDWNRFINFVLQDSLFYFLRDNMFRYRKFIFWSS